MNAETLRAAVGKRATIRLRDSDGGFRDIVGVLHSETRLINRRGEFIEFELADIAFFRVIPVFNRRDAASGQLHIYDTRTREVQEIARGNPQWPQAFYGMPQVFEVETGDILLSRCTFNSTLRNTTTHIGWIICEIIFIS